MSRIQNLAYDTFCIAKMNYNELKILNCDTYEVITTVKVHFDESITIDDHNDGGICND